MKAKKLEKEQAIELRKQGLSYREIQAIVPVSQASLSLWLSGFSLTDKQKRRLADLSLKGQVAGAKARRTQRLDKLALLIQEVELELPELLKNSFFIMGLALYWAEGSKAKPWYITCSVIFSNSDELLILLMRKWFKKFCNVQEKDLYYRLYIHMSADAEKAQSRWSEILNIDSSEIAVTIKKNNSKFRRVNENYKGLISITVRKSTWLNRRIDLWGKGAAKHFLD